MAKALDDPIKLDGEPEDQGEESLLKALEVKHRHDMDKGKLSFARNIMYCLFLLLFLSGVAMIFLPTVGDKLFNPVFELMKSFGFAILGFYFASATKKE